MREVVSAGFRTTVLPHASALASAEDRLLAGLRAREDGALAALFERYGAHVQRVLVRTLGVDAELAAAGLRRTHWWTDDAGDFGLSLSVLIDG